MSYIRKVIGSDEKLILLTRLHWIYLVEAFMWLIGFIALGLLLEYMLWYFAGQNIVNFKIDLYIVQFNQNYTPIPWVFSFAGIVIFLPLFLKYISTEIGLTDRRIIHKKGLMMIEIQQIELEDVRGETIDHGWFGWLLGYGMLHFDCRFIDDIYLPATRNPYRLIKALHTARMRHENILYSIDDLDRDIVKIDQARVDALRARDKLKRLGRKLRGDFNRAEKNLNI